MLAYRTWFGRPITAQEIRECPGAGFVVIGAPSAATERSEIQLVTGPDWGLPQVAGGHEHPVTSNLFSESHD